MLAAVTLYELERLTLGRAAQLAEVPRVEFVMSLGQFKVFPPKASWTSWRRGVAEPIAGRFAPARCCSVASLESQANCMLELVQK
jgi:hypothetical protein